MCAQAGFQTWSGYDLVDSAPMDDRLDEERNARSAHPRPATLMEESYRNSSLAGFAGDGNAAQSRKFPIMMLPSVVLTRPARRPRQPSVPRLHDPAN